MTVLPSIGCFVMRLKNRWWLSVWLGVLPMGSVWGAEPTSADIGAERTRLEAEYGFRLDVATDPELDPVVFTEIVPFTAEESAVRLPEDQDLD